MGRGATLLLAVMVCASAPLALAESKRSPTSGAFVEGWDDFVLDGGRPPGALEFRLQLGGEGSDNLRLSPTTSDPERTTAGRTEGRLTGRLLPAVPLKTYVEGGQVHYTTRSAMTAYGAGIGFEGERHTLSRSVRAERGRPSTDVGVGGNVTNDALLLRFRYGLRTSRVEAWAGADRMQQHYPEVAAVRNGPTQGIQAGVAYLGFSRKLAPELVLGLSRTDPVADGRDFDQTRMQLALRYTPVRAVSLTARVDSTRMAFSVKRPEAFSFERVDRRRSLSVQGQVRVTRQAAWTLSFERLEGRSNKANLDFTADSATAALTIKLGSTNKPPKAPPAPGPGALRPHPIAHSAPSAPPAAVLEPAAVPETVAAAPVEPLEAVADSDLGGAMRIETRRREGETETVIHGAGLVSYSTLDLRGPLRFVVDLVGVTAPVSSSVALDTPLVRGIRVAAFRTAPTRVARVVFDLKEPIAAHLERDGDTLRVLLRPVVQSAAVPSDPRGVTDGDRMRGSIARPRP